MYIEAQNPRLTGTKDDKSISLVVSLSVQPSGIPAHFDITRVKPLVPAIIENRSTQPGIADNLGRTHRQKAPTPRV
jgi:hypothetical protein